MCSVQLCIWCEFNCTECIILRVSCYHCRCRCRCRCLLHRILHTSSYGAWLASGELFFRRRASLPWQPVNAIVSLPAVTDVYLINIIIVIRLNRFRHSSSVHLIGIITSTGQRLFSGESNTHNRCNLDSWHQSVRQTTFHFRCASTISKTCPVVRTI